MTKKIKVAVLGAGHLGQYHVQKYSEHPDVELIGVVDTDKNRAREIAKKNNTKAFFKHSEILKNVDAVSIAVPTEKHFDVACDVISAGVHLLIEKPITYDLDQAHKLVEMARQANLIIQIGLIERFNPAIMELQKHLKSPILIEANRRHLFTLRGTDVDVVLDLMIHDIDIALQMNPDSTIADINAVGLSAITDKTDMASARLTFSNGVIANLTASRISGENIRGLRVFQHEEYLYADYQKRAFFRTPYKASVEAEGDPNKVLSHVAAFPERDPLKDEIHAFINSIITGAPVKVTGEDGIKALDVALKIISKIHKKYSARVT